MNQRDIDQLRRDLRKLEADAEGYRRSERWVDFADAERRIHADTNRLLELEQEEGAT